MHILIAPLETTDTLVQFVSESECEDFQDFEGKAKTVTVRYEEEKTQIYVGVGDEEPSDELFQACTAVAVRTLITLKRTSASFLLPADNAPVIAEAIELAAYKFDKYKSEQDPAFETIELVGTADIDEIAMAVKRADAVCYARDLQNENASIVVPEYLANQAKKIAAISPKIKLEILDEKEIKAKGLNLLLAVGQGSSTPPRLIIMNYIGAPDDNEKQAIVGKGITFDSGGLNLKPSGSMEDMRMDMSGAAATLGIMKFLAETEPTINVIGVIPTAHNAISKDAYYVGDTYKSLNGKTVEVLNTDAEGRLVLADAITYTVQNYKPTKIFDMATLTGAILIALGDTMAGIFSNNKELAQEIFEAGERSGDRVWELPIREEHREAMKGDIADIRNISKLGRKCGSITAAAFLENFVEDTPWVHIDIAGAAWNDGEPRSVNPKYGTGFGVRLLLEYLIK